MAAPNPVVFNETYYLRENPDVAAAVKAGAYANGLQHWLAFGQFEDRPATPYFDWEVYRDNNPDLVEAGIDTKVELTQHFNQYGFQEPRLYLSSAVFNAEIYAAQNPDLAVAGITDPIALQQHFLNSGRYEGRIAIAGFDPVAYINSQPDLKALLAAGGNINGYTQADISKAGWFHYLNFGIDEGRNVPAPNPAVGISAASYSVPEGTAQVFTVTLSVPLTTDTTFTYNVTGDTKGGTLNAASPSDFVGVTGTVTIPAGQTKWTFTVTANADGVTEGLEGYKVTLFDSSLNVVKTSDVIGITDSDAPVTSKSFTLTTAADGGTGFLGGSADDTYYAAYNLSGGATDTASTTLTAGDNLNGGAGVDTLVIAVSGSGSARPAVTPTLAGIEKILVSNSAVAGGAEFNLSLTDSALTTVGTTLSTKAEVLTRFTNVGKVVAIEAKGPGDLAVEFADNVLTGTGDTVTLTLNNVGTATGASAFESSTGIETLRIASNGTTTNYLRLEDNVSAGTSTVIVTGPKALNLDLGLDDGISKVDASALGGSIVLKHILADKVTVLGSASDDVFDFGGGFDAGGTGTGIKDVVSGGAGNDTLIVNTDIVITDDSFKNVTSVETLKVVEGENDRAITLGANAQAAGITTVTESGSVRLDLTIDTGYTGTVTVNLATGSEDDSIVVSSGGSANLIVKASADAFADFSNGPTITGSDGTGTTDTLVLTANGDRAYLSNDITNIDLVTIATGAAATDGVHLYIDEDTVAAGQTLKIDASALGSGASFYLNGGVVSATGTGGTAKLDVTGGAGNDSIMAGEGNDTVIGGAGNDTIYGARGGDDSFVGGSGDDVFYMGGELTSGDTIDGGAGNDTLWLSSGTVTSAALSHVTGVENLVFSGNATLNSPIQFSSFDLSLDEDAGVLTLASGYTGATTVTLGAGDSVDNTGANVDLVVNIAAADYGSGTGVVIAGSSTGSNSVTVNLTASAGAIVNTLASGSYIDKVVVVDGGDGTGAGNDVSITLGTGYNSSIIVDASALDAGTLTSGVANADFENLTLNASTLTASYTLTATGGAGADSILGGAGNDTIIGGAGNDTIDGGLGNNNLAGGAGADSITAAGGNDVITGGDGNDTITAGAGNDNVAGDAGDDTLIFGANFDGYDTIAGGAGNDTLTIDQGTGGLGDLSFLNVTSIETLVLSTGTGLVNLDTRAQTAGVNTIVAAAGAVSVNAAGFTSGVTFNVSGNVDNVKLVGGAGADSFIFSSTGLTTGDSITGGAGTDTIVLSNGSGAGTPVVAVAGASVVGIEAITINDGASNTGSTGTVNLTLTGNFNGGSGITVDASALDSTEGFTFVNAASGAATVTGGAGSDSITGHSTRADVIVAGSGNDTIFGRGGNDSIDAGAGNDLINGGAGVDTLTGGAGNDTFVFASGDSVSTGVDIITDFSSGDVISLVVNLTSNTKLDVNYKGAAVDAAAAITLMSGSTGNAPNHIGQYVLLTGSQQLAVDLNGNGVLNSEDMYINLQGVTGLSNASVVLDATGAGSNIDVTGTIGDDKVTITGDTLTYTTGTGSGWTGSTGLTVNGLTFDLYNSENNTGTGSSGISFTGTGLSFTGGSGSDTLVLAGASGSPFGTLVHVSGVETIVASEGSSGIVGIGAGDTVSVVQSGGLALIVGNSGAETINLVGPGAFVAVADVSGGITVNGTTGEDAVFFVNASGATGTTGTFNLGDGTGDTLAFSDLSATGNMHAIISGVEAISGSSGADTIHLTNTGSDVLYVGGDSSGTGGIYWSNITSGDTIDLGATGGSDTVVFGSGFSISGTDALSGEHGLHITNFTAGASGTGDFLDFTHLSLNGGVVGSGAAQAVGGTGADVALGSNAVAYVTVAGGTLSASNFTTTGGQSGGHIYIGTTDNNPHLIFAASDTGATSVNVYLVDNNAQTVGGTSGVDANEIHLIGVIDLTTGGINTLAQSVLYSIA